MSGGLKISYLTYFNAGSHGDFGGDMARKTFNQRFLRVSQFAQEIGLKIIKVDTNLSEILRMKFVSTHTIRNLSCVLHLQKLFQYYYYSSALRFDNFLITRQAMARYDLLVLECISTESVKFYSTLSDKTREERTAIISSYDKSFHYLDVCVNPKSAQEKVNCSVCDKCLRTQLTLDVIGELKNFDQVFDLDLYYKHKDKYIGRILFDSKMTDAYHAVFDLSKNKMDQKAFVFFKDNNLTITNVHRWFGLCYYFNMHMKQIKKTIKKILRLN